MTVSPEYQKLTPEQIAVAEALRAERPPVMQGTNVIIDDTQRLAWYDKCTAAALALHLDDASAHRFFNIAGVPD